MEYRDWTAPAEAENRIRSELRASLAAYHELGPDYEDQVVNSFIDRVRPVLRSQQALQPVDRRYARGRRHRGPRAGLLIALALLFGWFVLSGAAFGSHHRFYYNYGGSPIGVPGGLPGISGPLPPAQPQIPSVPSVPIAPAHPQQPSGSSVQ
jgi:hypothetical protein